jgi:hypothetical protein
MKYQHTNLKICGGGKVWGYLLNSTHEIIDYGIWAQLHVSLFNIFDSIKTSYTPNLNSN